MTPITESTPPEPTPARWHQHTLDAWRLLRVEREARLKAVRERDEMAADRNAWKLLAQLSMQSMRRPRRSSVARPSGTTRC
jgi:hypothetical protein